MDSSSVKLRNTAIAFLSCLFLSSCISSLKLSKSSEPLPISPYEVISVYPNGEVNVSVYARLKLKPGETFLVPKKLLQVRYQDGQEIEVPVQVTSVQTKTDPYTKFPPGEGYQYSATKTHGVWMIQKTKKVVWGVIVDAEQFYYDGRFKKDALALGVTHEYQDPEDEYAERIIEYRAEFPNKKMNVEVEGFDVTVESTSYPAKRYSYDFEKLAPRFAP